MQFVDLHRSFVPVDKDKEASLDIGAYWGRRYGNWLNWDDILHYRRVVLLAEAASGKTEEFRHRAETLSAEGHHAFFLRVEALAEDGLEAAFETTDAARAFKTWKAIPEGRDTVDAWFFLDAVDEARLTNSTSFDRALRRFGRELAGCLERIHVFASCRVTDWRSASDQDAVMRSLPVHRRAVATEAPGAPQEDDDAALLEPIFGEKKDRERPGAAEKLKPPLDDLLVVRLPPLSHEQRGWLASAAGVNDHAAFTQAILDHGLEVLAERPGDLIALAEYWRDKGRFGSLGAMTAYGIERKLAERAFRPDNRELEPETATLGIERVAAALTLGKSLTLKVPGDEGDPSLASGALDTAAILPEWTEAQRNALLRRGVFAPATYGRLRFHHRSTQEYLTARWLDRLLRAGCPHIVVRELLFADRYGVLSIVPSLRAAAAWLALEHPSIRDEAIRREPLTLLRYGDPQSLPVEARARVLVSYAEKHAIGEISDDRLDHRSIAMFASPDLGAAVRRAWALNERDRFRVDVLRIIHDAVLVDCADIARSVALDTNADDYLRVVAIEALGRCEDASGLGDAASWLRSASLSTTVSIGFAAVLFPRHLSVEDLLGLIQRSSPARRSSLENWGRSLEALWHRCRTDAERLSLAGGLAELCLGHPRVAKHRPIARRYAELAKDLEPVARDAFGRFDSVPAPDEVIRLLMAVERADRNYNSAEDRARFEDQVNSRAGLKRQLMWADVAALSDDAIEPPWVCRRLQLLRRLSPDEQDDEQVFSGSPRAGDPAGAGSRA